MAKTAVLERGAATQMKVWSLKRRTGQPVAADEVSSSSVPTESSAGPAAAAPGLEQQRQLEYTQEGGDMMSQPTASPRDEVPRKLAYNDPDYMRTSDFEIHDSTNAANFPPQWGYDSTNHKVEEGVLDTNIALMRDLI